MLRWDDLHGLRRRFTGACPVRVDTLRMRTQDREEMLR